jgi:hypothetical protein
LLNESPGAGYLERRWPEAFKASGAWPIKSLRQAFLDGSLERLINPDEHLKRKVPEFVERGDFGLASGEQAGGTYQRVWFKEAISSDEVSFDADVYLLKMEKAGALRTGTSVQNIGEPTAPPVKPEETIRPVDEEPDAVLAGVKTIILTGAVPPELWNKVGIRLIPKLRSNAQPILGVNFSLEIDAGHSANTLREIQQALADLELTGKIKVEVR